jgi:hypothetical protein
MGGGSGRNDETIAEVLATMALVLAQANEQTTHGQHDQGEAEERRLDRFMRNDPSTFKGRYDPEGAQTWLQGVDQIFRAMVTSDDQKVRLATHMLAVEAEFWWANSKRRLEAGVVVMSWERFKEEFSKKYFPTDLRNKKEMEFLKLK